MEKIIKRPELLLPAGSKEKLEYAINYGADAVYLGMVDFSLRAMRKGELITLNNLKDCIDLAHAKNKKVYLTLNIFAYSNDIDQMIECAEKINEAKDITTRILSEYKSAILFITVLVVSTSTVAYTFPKTILA